MACYMLQSIVVSSFPVTVTGLCFFTIIIPINCCCHCCCAAIIVIIVIIDLLELLRPSGINGLAYKNNGLGAVNNKLTKVPNLNPSFILHGQHFPQDSCINQEVLFSALH